MIFIKQRIDHDQEKCGNEPMAFQRDMRRGAKGAGTEKAQDRIFTEMRQFSDCEVDRSKSFWCNPRKKP